MSFEKLLIITTNTINLIFYNKIFYIIYKYIVRKFKIFISSIVNCRSHELHKTLYMEYHILATMIIIITTKKMCNFQIGQWFWKKKNTLHFWYFFTLSSILCEHLSRRKLDKIESTRSGQFSSSTENSSPKGSSYADDLQMDERKLYSWEARFNGHGSR